MSKPDMHIVVTLCPICSKVSHMGHTDMSSCPLKYICPLCEGRHYGEPVNEDDIEYRCGKCNETSSKSVWTAVPLDAGEQILGPVQSCDECNKKLEDPEMCAFIEVEDGKTGDENRTGRIAFGKPHKEFLENLKGPRAVYIEKSVLEKMMKTGD